MIRTGIRHRGANGHGVDRVDRVGHRRPRTTPGGVAMLALLLATGCAAENDDRGDDSERSAGGAATASAPTERPVPAEGLPPAELQGRWWTWAASAIGDDNPVEDPDGHACAVGQPADVWFLAGTFGGYTTRDCTLPAGRPLAVPLVNLTSDEPTDCDALMADAQGSADLDGTPVQASAIPATPISYEGAADNPVTREAGTFQGYGCGLWVQLPPLSPGEHALAIRGRSTDFSTGVDYLLHVVDPASGDVPTSGRPSSVDTASA